MTDFLLELLSEEIPARMQEKASADLARLFAEELAKAGLEAEALTSYVTPRRLALIARGLPLETAAVSEEIKGPRASAPPQALEGFLRKTGLSREQLVDRDGVLFAVIEKPGRATADVLAEAIPAIIRGFPWPKSMRWGTASASTASLRWVRPLQGIVALLGDDVVPLEIDGIVSRSATVGHRFHHAGPITIGNADDYAAKLRACHVIVDAEERRRIIRDGAAAVAAAAGLTVVPDEGLVAENAGLTEWPVPLLGAFDPAFLAVPREVIQLTMRTNQKYFACTEGEGKLAPNFICTANIVASDGGTAIVAGNRKVLAARLSDAKFFWEQDLKVPLAESAKKLDQIVFHEKLGTVADKVDRVAKLARWLVEEGIVTSPSPPSGGEGRGEGAVLEAHERSNLPDSPLSQPSPPKGGEGFSLADQAELAARLCKADLVTGMVGEFPELQGIMGGYYARAEGLPDAVADAIRDHYKPVGQGDDVPTAPVTVAVSLADKLDTIAGFFMKALKPTGSKDPFALRRAALGIMAIVFETSLRGQLTAWLAQARQNYREQNILDERPDLSPADSLREELEQQYARIYMYDIKEFVQDRLKVQQREAGVRHDLIDAVFALGGEDDLVRLLARVKALQAFVTSEDGTNLLAGYKRAANILKKESSSSFIPAKAGISLPVGDGEGKEIPAFAGMTVSYTPEPAEAALIAALESAEPRATAAIAAEDFAGAMTALATLRGPIDAFFTEVTVNDVDPEKRLTRLAILEKIRAAVHKVADFSKIEG